MRVRRPKWWHFLFSAEPLALHTNRISIPAFLKMVCLSAKLQIPTAAASSTFAGQSDGKAMTVKMHVGTLGFQWRQHGRLKESDVSRAQSSGSRLLQPLLPPSPIISHDAQHTFPLLYTPLSSEQLRKGKMNEKQHHCLWLHSYLR